MCTFFNEAPQEVILQILLLLDRNDIFTVQKVCQRLHALGLNNAIWRALFNKYFDKDNVSEDLDQSFRNKFIVYYLLQKWKIFGEMYDSTIAGKYFDLIMDQLNQTNSKADQAWKSYILGELYCCGYGIKFDNLKDKRAMVAKGEAHLWKAAHLGDTNAMVLLAKIYFDNFQNPKDEWGIFGSAAWCAYRHQDYITGNAWLMEAFNQHNKAAVRMFAGFCITGQKELNIACDPLKGLALLEKAAAEGDAEAAYDLALMYRNSKNASKMTAGSNTEFRNYMRSINPEMLPQNFIDVLKRFVEKEGSSDARSILVHIYQDGMKELDIEPNIELAQYYRFKPQLQNIFYWLNTASKLGHRRAGLMLANIYFTGSVENSFVRCKTDPAQGILCLKEAANIIKSSQIAYKLGCIYAANNPDKLYPDKDSQNVNILEKTDINEAIKWFTLGTKINDGYAELCAYALGEIYSSEKFGIALDKDQAIYWYKQGIKLNSLSCMISLATLYLRTGHEEAGQSVEELADKLFMQAIEKYDNPDIAHSIASQVVSEDKNANLIHYIRWQITGIGLGSQKCLESLHQFFVNRADNIVDPIVTTLARLGNSKSEKLSSIELVNLLKDCCLALDLPNVPSILHFVSKDMQGESTVVLSPT